MSLPIDDLTAVYILETRRHFEDLRQVSGQLAGFLVLSASGANSASPDHPLLPAARELHRAAQDGVRSARPTERARMHHRALLDSAAALAQALEAAKAGEVDPVLIPLRAADAHLRRASRELPGFEMVAFEQGCCARVA
jgi:hypothetical protein